MDGQSLFDGTLSEFDRILAANSGALFVVHFWAEWAPQCEVIESAISELSKELAHADVRFVKVDAEGSAEVSLKYAIEAVPTVLFLFKGSEADRVNGVNVADIAAKTRRLLAQPPPVAAPAESLEDRLRKLVNQSTVVLFMKGNSEAPRCGFSKQAVAILKSKGVEFTTFDILEDEEVRQGLKKFSNWQTYPQLYAKGQLIGGVDIMRDLDEAGELESSLL